MKLPETTDVPFTFIATETVRWSAETKGACVELCNVWRWYRSHKTKYMATDSDLFLHYERWKRILHLFNTEKMSDKWMAHLCQGELVGSFLVEVGGRSGSEWDRRLWQRWKPRACTHTLPLSQSDRECCRLLGCQQPAAQNKQTKKI